MDAYHLPHTSTLPSAERQERIARLAEQLRACLDGLDDLELWKAGAHADLALTEVERHL